MRTSFFRLYHIIVGLIALVTIVYDLTRNISQIFIYFSYFSNQCIAITALIFLYLGIAKKDSLQKSNIISVRGALVVYMIIVAAIYALLLANIIDTSRVEWINFVYHKLLPGAALLSWIVFPPKKALGYKNIIYWFIYPFMYVVLTLIRGYLIKWYPYFFLDPANGGYSAVISFSLKLVLAGFVISFLVITVGNFMKKLNLTLR